MKKVELKHVKDPVFFERIAYFRNFGYGTMLVYWNGKTLEYVQFTPVDSFVKEVLSRELLDLYKKDMFSEPVERIS